MKKTIIQGIVILSLFFATWFTLRQFNWMTILKIRETTQDIEEAVGSICWETFRSKEEESTNLLISEPIKHLVNTICIESKIDTALVKVHIINNDIVNAFALPNGHLIIYSGLISAVDNEEELSGVICHELAHIQLNHVMQKITKEMGISTLLASTIGGGNANAVMKKILKTLSSTAFDRGLEKEADKQAIDYLIAAKINPEPFANFFYKLAKKDTSLTTLSWINTHPSSKERLAYILEYSRGKSTNNNHILTEDTWVKIKEEINNLDEGD